MAKARDWTPEDDARLLALQAEGHSAEGIAEHMPAPDNMPYSRHQITKRCRELGVKPAGRRFGPGARFTGGQIERMQRLFAAGASLGALAAEFGCGSETIRQMALARILVRDPATDRADLEQLRSGAVARPHQVRQVRHPKIPEAPSSDLWRLWERAESNIRGVAA